MYGKNAIIHKLCMTILTWNRKIYGLYLYFMYIINYSFLTLKNGEIVYYNMNNNNNNEKNGDKHQNINKLNSEYINSSVINLSSYTLDEYEQSVLELGLNFCPTPIEPNFGEIKKDLNKFHCTYAGRIFLRTLLTKKVLRF